MSCILLMNKCVLVHCCNIILTALISFGPSECHLTETKKKLPGSGNVELQLKAAFHRRHLVSFGAALVHAGGWAQLLAGWRKFCRVCCDRAEPEYIDIYCRSGCV